jgi:4-amino-4-deoxy-L-arabinose transferase-like glycosyltransferase
MPLLKKYSLTLTVLLCMLIAAFPIFTNLDHWCIKLWDEAHTAINALEMSETGNLIVATFRYQPDLLYVKPPLQLWIEALSIKLLGFNELAVRLPAAIAALLTCTAIAIFLAGYIKNNLLAVFSVLVLVTSVGFVGYHASRTGDLDSMLTLFTTLHILLFFMVLEESEGAKQNNLLHLSFVALTLAALTKGLAGVMLLPGVLIYTLLRGKLLMMLKNKWFYIDSFLFAIIVLGYYFLRDYYTPGYIKSVLETEIFRYKQVIDNHREGTWHYFLFLKNNAFSYWYLVVLFAPLTLLILKPGKVKNLVIMCIIVSIVYLAVITSSVTKIHWYLTTIMPFLAILTGAGIHFIIGAVASFLQDAEAWKKLTIQAAILLAIFVPAYTGIMATVYKPAEEPWLGDSHIAALYLRDCVRSKTLLNNYKVFRIGVDCDTEFYIRRLNQMGSNICLKYIQDLQPSDTVIGYNPEYKAQLLELYNFDTLSTIGPVDIYLINSYKSDSSTALN